MKNTEKLNIPKITLQNGREINYLVQEINQDQDLSVIDTSVLKRLINYLPTVSFGEIKRMTINDISLCENIEDLVNIMKQEINFHESINIIKQFTKFENNNDK